MCVGMVLLCVWYGFAMVLVWFWYGFAMVLLWCWHGFGMVLPWFWYGVGMVLVWFCHGVDMFLSWKCLADGELAHLGHLDASLDTCWGATPPVATGERRQTPDTTGCVKGQIKTLAFFHAGNLRQELLVRLLVGAQLVEGLLLEVDEPGEQLGRSLENHQKTITKLYHCQQNAM